MFRAAGIAREAQIIQLREPAARLKNTMLYRQMVTAICLTNGGKKMIVKNEMSGIDSTLGEIQESIEDVVKDYIDNYADYGWDNFSETLANVSAQIYMLRIQCRNAIVKKTELSLPF